MKNCTIYGEISSEAAREDYPTVTVCEDCIEDSQMQEDSLIIFVHNSTEELIDEQCEFCGKALEDDPDRVIEIY